MTATSSIRSSFLSAHHLSPTLSARVLITLFLGYQGLAPRPASVVSQHNTFEPRNTGKSLGNVLPNLDPNRSESPLSSVPSDENDETIVIDRL
jgi:hypothetical protein